MGVRKVLIANRGEIAIRVARAARDHGLASVAVYAEPDIDSLHVKAADEAIALGGSTAADSYLVFDKIIGAAKKSGSDAVHPGYGFLSENAEFAQAVIDAGLTWIGPPPAAIRSLGDKVAARHIAQRAGAPLVAGTKDPVSGADEVVAFAKEFGLPIAVEILSDKRACAAARGIMDGRLEGAVAVAQQHRHGACRDKVRHGEVGFAVPVGVPQV